MTYPKLPGLPTQPGLYEMRNGDRRECARVRHRVGGGDLFAASTDGTWAGVSNTPGMWGGWTWYGPIPPPLAGERKPAKGWAKVVAEVERATIKYPTWPTEHGGRRPMTYPKLPGLPTQPGLYEITRGNKQEFARVWADDDGRMMMADTWGYTGPMDGIHNVGWTWRGPIPPPQTGERKPAKGWEKHNDGYVMRVGWGVIAGVYPATDGGHIWYATSLPDDETSGHRRTLRDALFAAEDALAELRDAINNALGDNPAKE